MVHVMPLFVRKWPSIVSLKAPSRALLPGMECVGGGPAVYH